jgi:hypothetical protein
MFALALVVLVAVPLGDVKGPLVLDLGTVKATLRASVSLRVEDLGTYGAEGLGYIDWRWPGGANTDGLTLTFSRAVSFVSLEAGDWGSDDDGPLELTAWDCDHRLLATTKKPWGLTREWPFETLRVEGKGICQVRYRSGGQYAGSTYITRIHAE